MTTQIHVHETAVDSARPRRRPFGPAAAVLAGLAAIGMSLWSALNNDVTYALGGLETAGAGGVSVWDVFVARPVAYRLIIALLDLPVPGGAPLTTAHEIVRLGAYVLVAGVAFVLYLGLRRFVTEPAAAVTAVATGLTLIVAPQWHFLEPDWVAGLVAVLAVGAACAPRQVWLGAVLGGFAAFLAVAVKLATFPLALLALLLVALVSRRRAAWAAAATVGFTVIWYLATRTFLPWEWTWLNDQAHLIVNAPVHQGIRWHDIERMLIAIGEVAVLSPIVAVAPAAAAVLVRRLDPGRPRWIGAGIAVLAAGMSVASAYGQGEFFMYHFAAVPVFAAGVVGAAFGLSPGARTPLVMTTGLAAVASFFLLRQAPEWRHDNVTFVAVGYAVIAVTGAVVAGRPARWRAPATLGAVVLS
ncbi:MAG TPA: hypothetical protein VFG35_24835, partial [Actinoplanes sp.]|nr:hypothetical protein [Actinoplanes sp.]